MIVRTRVTLYAGEGDHSGVVRVGTVGVEHKRIIRFYDVSGKYFVAFSRQDCIEQKAMFECRQGMEERDVPVTDVLKILTSHKELPSDAIDRITAEIISL